MPARTKQTARKVAPTFKARDGSAYRPITPKNLINPDTSGIAVQVVREPDAKNIAIQEDGSVLVD